MLRIAIIGCGKQADAHAAPIQGLSNCEIVGVCDREELMAKQLHERFHVKHYFSDANRLLEVTHLDIIHITTFPQGHFELANGFANLNKRPVFPKRRGLGGMGLTWGIQEENKQDE